MAKKSRVKKMLLSVISLVVAFVVIILIAATLFVRFYVIPKYNSLSNSGELTGRDMVTFARYLTDGQLLKNIKNFNKDAAKEVLSVIEELDGENDGSHENSMSLSGIWSKPLVNTTTAMQKVTPAPEKVDEFIKNAELSQKELSAYERIMAAATPEEIRAGMAIIAKVDLAKVNSLQKQNKTVELKKYIKSVLTSAEISKSLSLYKKYKHLL